jgi:hypothetical protein
MEGTSVSPSTEIAKRSEISIHDDEHNYNEHVLSSGNHNPKRSNVFNIHTFHQDIDTDDIDFCDTNSRDGFFDTRRNLWNVNNNQATGMYYSDSGHEPHQAHAHHTLNVEEALSKMEKAMKDTFEEALISKIEATVQAVMNRNTQGNQDTQKRHVSLMNRESAKVGTSTTVLTSVAKLCTIRPSSVLNMFTNSLADDNVIRVKSTNSCMPGNVILIDPTEPRAEVNSIESVQANGIIICQTPMKYNHSRDTIIQVFSNVSNASNARAETTNRQKVFNPLTDRPRFPEPINSPSSPLSNRVTNLSMQGREITTDYLEDQPLISLSKLNLSDNVEPAILHDYQREAANRSINDPSIEMSAVSLLTEASNWAHRTFPVQKYYHPLDKDSKLYNQRKLDPLIFTMEGELYSRFLKKQIAQEQIFGTKLLSFIYIMRSKTWIKPGSPAWTRFDHISERDLEGESKLLSEEEQLAEYQRLQILIGQVMEVPFDRDSVLDKLYSIPKAVNQLDLMRLYADISNVFNEYPAWIQNPKNTLDAIKKGLSELPRLRRRFI